MQVFISYAREDLTIAEKLRSDLVAAGYNPWMDTSEIAGGERWSKAITAAIGSSRAFVVLLSRKSEGKKFVQQEIALAFATQDNESHRVVLIIPLRIEDFHPANERLNELNWIACRSLAKGPWTWRRTRPLVLRGHDAVRRADGRFVATASAGRTVRG